MERGADNLLSFHDSAGCKCLSLEVSIIGKENEMKRVAENYLVVFSILLLSIWLGLIQVKEYSQEAVLSIIYFINLYTLLFKFKDAARMVKAVVSFVLLGFTILFLLYIASN